MKSPVLDTPKPTRHPAIVPILAAVIGLLAAVSTLFTGQKAEQDAFLGAVDDFTVSVGLTWTLALLCLAAFTVVGWAVYRHVRAQGINAARGVVTSATVVAMTAVLLTGLGLAPTLATTTEATENRAVFLDQNRTDFSLQLIQYAFADYQLSVDASSVLIRDKDGNEFMRITIPDGYSPDDAIRAIDDASAAAAAMTDADLEAKKKQFTESWTWDGKHTVKDDGKALRAFDENGNQMEMFIYAQ